MEWLGEDIACKTNYFQQQPKKVNVPYSFLCIPLSLDWSDLQQSTEDSYKSWRHHYAQWFSSCYSSGRLIPYYESPIPPHHHHHHHGLLLAHSFSVTFILFPSHVEAEVHLPLVMYRANAQQPFDQRSQPRVGLGWENGGRMGLGPHGAEGGPNPILQESPCSCHHSRLVGFGRFSSTKSRVLKIRCESPVK